MLLLFSNNSTKLTDNLSNYMTTNKEELRQDIKQKPDDYKNG